MIVHSLHVPRKCDNGGIDVHWPIPGEDHRDQPQVQGLNQGTLFDQEATVDGQRGESHAYVGQDPLFHCEFQQHVHEFYLGSHFALL